MLASVQVHSKYSRLIEIVLPKKNASDRAERGEMGEDTGMWRGGGGGGVRKGGEMAGSFHFSPSVIVVDSVKFSLFLR